MKRLFNFTKFLSLISVQCSLAQAIPTTSTQITQVENRLEDTESRTAGTNQNTDYRLQGAGTNQVTGCRLQVVGNRKAELPSEDHIGQRVELTTNCDNNQVAGCRLQTTGSRKTASLSENLSFQIGQRVELTTNCELRTTNCDNSAESLNCHLMMNPSTEEEGIKAIEKILGISEQRVVTAEGERIKVSEGKYLVKPSTECATTNYQDSSNCACSSRSQLPSLTAAAVSPTSDLLPPTSIEPPALLDDLAENIGRRLLGKIVAEQALQDPLEKNSCSSDVRWNAGKSHAEGNDLAWNALTEEERSIYNTEVLAKNKAQSEAIQKEIEEAEQEAEKAHCRMGEAWLSSTRAARAVIAKTAKEKVEGMKTTKAERQRAIRWANHIQGKDRDFWQALVDQHKVATDYEGKSLEISLAGKESEGGSWFLVGRSLHANADYREKAYEAKEVGKDTLATTYIEAALISQEAATQRKIAAETMAAGEEDEGMSWEQRGSALQAKADYEVKASEAQEAGKTILAAGYREAVATSQHAADQWKISAEKHAVGEEDRGLRWGMVGSSFRDKAEYEVKASEAQEAGKTTLAAGYRQAASLSKSAANHWKLSVLTKIEGSEKEGEGDSLGHEGLCFKKQARYEANASEAEEAGKTNLAIGYREASKTLQDAVDEHQQAVIAYSKRKNNEGSLYNLAGNSLQAKADHQAKASEAQEAGKTILATSYREIATTYQRVTDQYQQSVKTYAEGKKGETTIWHSIGVCLQASADYQAKASDAQEVGNGLLAAGYREVIATSERAADQFKQAVLAEIARKWDESRKLYDEGEATRKEAHAIAKRVEERAAAALLNNI